MIRAVLIAVEAMLVCSCQTLKPADQPQQTALPDYGELVARYDHNLRGMDRLWSRASVEASWTDDKGKHHYAQGDNSKLMMVGRDRLALSIGKSVKDLLWIGCDPMRYWWIELGEEPVALVGWHDKLYAGKSYRLPVDIRPLDLPVLMGLVQFNPNNTPKNKPYVTRYKNNYVISPPGSHARITLDIKTALPVKVEMFDRQGRLVITSTLSKPSRVKMHNRSPGDWPTIMTRTQLTVADREGKMTIHLSAMTDARSDDETRKDRALQHAFDYDKLKVALQVAKQISLDK